MTDDVLETEERVVALTTPTYSDTGALAKHQASMHLARQHPRSVTRFQAEAKELVSLDQATAVSCMYALPRAGKNIRGPSVRFAEIVRYSWGNCISDGGVIEVGDTHLVAEGRYVDLERNTGIAVRVSRRITDSLGRRYNDDMIMVTGNAAVAIAIRNAELKGIPKPLWQSIYDQARFVAIGQAGTLTDTRDKWLTWYAKVGIESDRVCEMLGVAGIQDIGMDEIEVLVGASNAIADGDLRVEDLVAAPAEEGKPAPSLRDRLRQVRTSNGAVAERAVQLKKERDALDGQASDLFGRLHEAGLITQEEWEAGRAWLDRRPSIGRLRERMAEWESRLPTSLPETQPAPEHGQDNSEIKAGPPREGTPGDGRQPEPLPERPKDEPRKDTPPPTDPPDPGDIISRQRATALAMLARQVAIPETRCSSYLETFGLRTWTELTEEQADAAKGWIQSWTPQRGADNGQP